MREIKDRQELEYLLGGLAVLGTGGGGDPERSGRPIFDHDVEKGVTYRIYHPDEIPDDALIISGGYLGSVAAADKEDEQLFSRRYGPESELAGAIREMENLLERKAEYIVPFEMGGGNTPVIMNAGAHLGIKVVDGDALGRAAPETHMTSWIGHGISLTPMPLVDSKGGIIIVKGEDIFYPDEVGRFVAVHGRGSVANTHYPMSGADLKRSVIPGTISQALELGRFLHGLSGSPEELLEAISQYMQGFPLFWGKVNTTQGEDRGGFYFLNVAMTGLGPYEGCHFDLLVKNETMCARRDGHVVSIFPDLLLLIDPSTCQGVMTPNVVKDRELIVIGVPCHERLRQAIQTEKGKAAFSSKRYGQDLEYRPIEELVGG